MVYDLYTYLKSCGHQVCICYGRGAEIKEPGIIKTSFNIETYIHAALARFTGLNGCYSLFSTLRLMSVVKKFKPDAIHLHELHGYYLNFGMLIKFLIRENLPVVWTFHCEYMYTGKCGLVYDCEGWLNDCGNCPMLREYPASLLFDFTGFMLKRKREMMKSFTNLIVAAPSPWLVKRIDKSGILGMKEAIIVFNGIDTTVFKPHNIENLKKELNITKKKVVLSVAPKLMSELKGGHFIIEIAKKMKPENLVFILVGADSNESYDNVIMLRKITDQKKLAMFYSLADVFLICSHYENFSTTIAESICCGTPVTGFKCGGPETFYSQEYASFCQYGDIDALVNLIKMTIDRAIRRDECSQYGHEMFSKEKMGSAYTSLYNKIIKNNNILYK